MKVRMVLATAVLALAMQCSAFGSGMLIPKDGSIPPLAVKSQRVDIRIKDGTATAKIVQVFKNSVDRDLEATYVFPLPANAAIADFAMYINGKRVSGELVEKEKARRIYEDIVRRMRDPGLLEHMGGNLFQVRVYPVPRNGEQKIEIEYSQTLDFEAGLYKFVYPLRTGDMAARTLEDFTVSARLVSSVPIRTIYSPSHKVGSTRKGEGVAVIGFEEDAALLDRDFVLYYGVDNKEFGLNLLTHAVKGEDGFFMLMLAPTVVQDDAKAIRKDIVFVMDTSGSMGGKKIEQARKALEYCIGRLNRGDRFNIVRFSTDVEKFRDSLVEADEENMKAALKFATGLSARGGTDINGALAAALDMEFARDRARIVAFLTDGRPTVGETDVEAIVSGAGARNKASARVFVFGVGDDVNTHLLDKISGESGGMSQYVQPDEDIEVKVSTFSDKTSYPVLANPRVAIDKLETRLLHPKDLPDLFCGDQLTVFGRYRGDGHVAIRLTGEVNGEKKEYVYEGTFPKVSADNDFIPRLWATRRVGYLLDEVRLHGEEKELKDEVVQLGRDYGIMTPYTSYLVLESDEAYRQNDIPMPAASAAPAKAPAADASALWSARREGAHDKDMRDAIARTVSEPKPAVPIFGGGARSPAETAAPVAQAKYRVTGGNEGRIAEQFKRDSGAAAVRLSQAIGDYKKAEHESQSAAVRHVGKKTFTLLDGTWIDSGYAAGMKAVRVKFGSDEYFELLSDKPDLRQYLALGEKVIVALGDGTAVVVE